ncbi:MAG: cytochrome c [Candidatus Eremiobacteraeota bacterium]|nr:cytochrome c [Candidatus Eremiobacteraeota bacterium]MCW5872392.1 cytochrome c [Candidatus Eremiobacteraeota bacterium]
MSNLFEADRVGHEKPDPIENSSSRLIVVPLTLLTLFLAFGMTYLTIYTDKVDFTQGDSRSQGGAALATPLSDPSLLGQEVFQKNCQACHQVNGAGVGSTFPPLDGSEWVNGEPEMVCAIVLHGISGEISVKGQAFRGVMPAFKGQLKPEEIAAVATYIRGAWSNRAAAVEPALVEKVAQATATRKESWSGGAELEKMPWK